MIPKLTTEHTENTECSVVDVIGLVNLALRFLFSIAKSTF